MLKGPFYTLLLYLWIAYFRPETWMWDPTLFLSLNLSLLTGIVLLGSSLLSDVKWRVDLRTILLFLFLLQDTASTLSSAHFDYSSFYWQDFAKCVVITYLISVLVDEGYKVRMVVLVMALSLGFEAAKQGWAGLLLSPGAKNLNGVTIFGDENDTAVGIFMLVPLLSALAATATSMWQRRLFQVATIGIFYRGLVTYSRGGFLTCIAILFVFFIRSRHKIRTLLAMAIVGMMILPVLPSTFWARMQTITVSEDKRNEASEGRLHMWEVARSMAAAHPLLGVGHNAFNAAFDGFDTTLGSYGTGRAVHSAWFGALADLGYPGVCLFLANVAFTFVSCFRVIRGARGRPDQADLKVFAIAIATSMVAFVVGGSFVTFHYNEMLWHLMGLSAAIAAIALREKSTVAREVAAQPVAPLNPARIAMRPMLRR